jgi:hypothetical protein
VRPDRRSALGLIAGALATGVTPALAATPRERRAVAITARPLPAFEPRNPDRRQFGALSWRGGLELRSSDREFGGFSGLWRSGDGQKLVAITDVGSWLTADITSSNGRPTGLVNAEMAPILNAAGRAVRRTRSYDTEALTIVDGTAWIGIERSHEILRFDWARDGMKARGQSVPVPPAVKRLPSNKGLEAIGIGPAGLAIAGAIVAIAERSGSADAPTAGWIIGGARPGAFQVRRKDGFDITDLAFLPGGDMVLLERWYQPWRGVAFRLRRIKGVGIRPDALLDGETLFEADLGYEIDNMEGMAVHSENGQTILTLISDDNFSFIQRTILLEFVLG